MPEGDFGGDRIGDRLKDEIGQKRSKTEVLPVRPTTYGPDLRLSLSLPLTFEEKRSVVGRSFFFLLLFLFVNCCEGWWITRIPFPAIASGVVMRAPSVNSGSASIRPAEFYNRACCSRSPL